MNIGLHLKNKYRLLFFSGKIGVITKNALKLFDFSKIILLLIILLLKKDLYSIMVI